MKTNKPKRHIIYVVNRYTLEITQYCKITIKKPDLHVLISTLNNNVNNNKILYYIEFTEQYTKDNDIINIIKDDIKLFEQINYKEITSN